MKKLGMLLWVVLVLGGCSLVNQSKGGEAKLGSGIESVDMTLDEAKDLYEKEYPNTQVTSVDISKSFGTYDYTVEGIDDTQEYEVVIDTQTQNIKTKKSERLDKMEKKEMDIVDDAIDFSNLKSLDDIIKIAESTLEQSVVVSAKLEKELNMELWEIEVENQSKEIEIQIDGVTGEIYYRD